MHRPNMNLVKAGVRICTDSPSLDRHIYVSAVCTLFCCVSYPAESSVTQAEGPIFS